MKAFYGQSIDCVHFYVVPVAYIDVLCNRSTTIKYYKLLFVELFHTDCYIIDHCTYASGLCTDVVPRVIRTDLFILNLLSLVFLFLNLSL